MNEPTPNPFCPLCGGHGLVVVAVPGHDPRCEGECRYCPIPIPAEEYCECIEQAMEVGDE
jgi:hypothetical protein